MSSIHETRHGTHELRWRENGRPKTLTRKTRPEAEREQERVDRRNAEGRPVMRRKDVPTLEEFSIKRLARWTHLDEDTLKGYVLLLEAHVFPFLGHLSLVELLPSRLQEWQDERLDAGAGPSSIGRVQMVLGMILKKAVLPYEYIDFNPILALDTPTYKKKAHRWLSAKEVEAIRSWYLERDDLGSATFISVQAYVGIRPEDTLARMWSDLTHRGNRHELSVTSKNVNGKIVEGDKTGEGKKRRVEVPGPVADDLEEWRLASSSTGLIFYRAKDGLPWTKSDYDNWRARYPRKEKGTGIERRPPCFKRAAEDLGLGESLRPYDLRHTFASLAASAGWTGDEIANQLGNGVDVVDRVYRHLIDAEPGARHNRRTVDDYIREARGLATLSQEAPFAGAA